MDKGYIHVEVESAQSSKKGGAPCGDVVAYRRTVASTTLVVSDGMGSGIKAHVAAQMSVSRMLALLDQGCSLRKAFAGLVRTLDQAKGTDMPYAVLSVVRILSDGVATILSYEMPAPVFVTPKYSQVLPQRMINMEGVLVGEANCHVAPGEGIMVVSDGITQAGLGRGLPQGWTIEGASHYINDCLNGGARVKDIPRCVLNRAREVWKTSLGDDCTAALASCRRGRTVNVLTGPPGKPANDRAAIQQFLLADGSKVVCGGTTAKIVADYLGVPVTVEENPSSVLAPARYFIDGIELVTEGAVTLNQVYNVLGHDANCFDEVSGVTELYDMLTAADRVNLLVGSAVNPANSDISFLQKGILSRHAIVPLLADKLQDAGKLVVVETI